MIRAKAPTAALAQQLVRVAGRLAQARAEMAARRGDASRWRSPVLLWPLFGKD